MGGMLVLLAAAWLLSVDRRRFPLKCVIGGMALQVALALFVLRTDVGAYVFNRIGDLVAVVLSAGDTGTRFVFGALTEPDKGQWGMIFAFKALPNIIVFSALSMVGYHLGILQRVVAAMAWVMARLMGTSGAESLSAAANVFMGQTEAPLFVRPYIPRMTESELNAVMIGGFATIAGSLMAVYAGMLGHNDPASISNMARHLLTASLISSPASLVVAKLMIPERGLPDTAGRVRLQLERTTRNIIDAAATGALEGLKLALNVGAMLIAFIAIITLLDRGLVWVGSFAWPHRLVEAMGLKELTLNGLLGLLFSPVAWIIGIGGDDCRSFGTLLGQAMAVNEFVAYKSLAEMISTSAMSPRSETLAVYALCGFANFSSIAIQIAGIGGMAPQRYGDLSRLGLRAMLGGAIACWITACVAGALLPAA